MKPQDLRSGNFVLVRGEICKVLYCDLHSAMILMYKNMDNFRESYNDINPLPITKELLESVGFEHRGDGEYFIELKRPNKNVPIMFKVSIPEMDIRIGSHGDYFELKGFHHLANIIYDLCGVELKIKL